MLTRRRARAAASASVGTDLLPPELVGSVIRKAETVQQVCCILALCKPWRTALSAAEWEQLWEHMVRRDFPRIEAILRHHGNLYPGVPDTLEPPATPWHDTYCYQHLAEAEEAVNTTETEVPACLLNNDRLDSYIFTAELRLDGELKASWTGPGVPTRFRDLEATDSFREARLRTMLPDWYGKEVDQLMLAGGSQTGSKFIDWGDRLELTLFVSRLTGGSLIKTGKLFYNSYAYLDDRDTNWQDCVLHQGQAGWYITSLIWFDDDPFCGRLHFRVELWDSEAQDVVEPPRPEDEKSGVAIQRMIHRCLDKMGPASASVLA